MVTYNRRVFDDNSVFKALADPTRPFLLDLLFKRDGRTLMELESELEMTRFSVMRTLPVLECAGVVATRHALGGRRAALLEPGPIRMIHNRWIDKYTERRVCPALLKLKTELEAKTWRQSQKRAWRSNREVYEVYFKNLPTRPGGCSEHDGRTGMDGGAAASKSFHGVCRAPSRQRVIEYIDNCPEMQAIGSTSGVVIFIRQPWSRRPTRHKSQCLALPSCCVTRMKAEGFARRGVGDGEGRRARTLDFHRDPQA